MKDEGHRPDHGDGRVHDVLESRKRAPSERDREIREDLEFAIPWESKPEKVQLMNGELAV